MSQKTAILRYMKLHGAISPLAAMRHFNCLRLSERIRELQAEGHTIVNIGRIIDKPDGKRVKIGYYRLQDTI